MKINRKKRIITDLQRLREPPDPRLPTYDIRQEKCNDLNVVYTEIRGPADSLYSGGFFVIRFEFTSDYPVSSPSVALQTKIWHPNVDHNSGSVCLNSLNQQWQPTVHLRHILDHHIPWLLENGNPDDPLNSDAGAAMKSGDANYPQKVRQWVRRYAAESQLHSHGAVWYRQSLRTKKKKKKKRFSLRALSKEPVVCHGVTTPMASKKGLSSLKCTESDAAGHADTAQGGDFQDWWSQCKLLPATPSQSGLRLPIEIEPAPFDDDDDDDDDGGAGGGDDDGEQIPNEPVRRRTVPLGPQRNKRRRKMKKLQLEPAAHFLDGAGAATAGDGDLSSMDEDPVSDLLSYRSLTAGDAGHCAQCLTPFCPLPAAGSLCPEFSPLAPVQRDSAAEAGQRNADRILHSAPLHGHGRGAPSRCE